MRIDKNTTIRLGDRNIVKIKIGDSVIWQKTTEPDYFYVENIYAGGNTISVKQTLTGSPDSSTYAKTLQYSKDKTTWSTITLSSTEYTITLNQGEKVYFRGNEGVLNYYANDGAIQAITNILGTQSHTIGGNINTLVNYITPNELTLPQGVFAELFQNNTTITSAENLTLQPSSDDSIPNYGYHLMFSGCSALITPPSEIPATKQGHASCGKMFLDCIQLKTPPALKSTILENYCFTSIFKNCTSLISAPELPALTLASNCYQSAFEGCTSLKVAPQLPATVLANYCYQALFKGCSALTTPPTIIPAKTAPYLSCHRMFNDCVSLTTAPELPATTVGSGAYQYMFMGCSNLQTAPSELPAETLALNSYYEMFRDCSQLTTAPTIKAKTFAENSCRAMFLNCSKLNNVTVYADDISATNCTSSWLNGVASTGTFNNYGDATYTINSVSGIPTGWTEKKPDYFYVENTYNGTNTISVKQTIKGSPDSSLYSKTLQYSKDKTNWSTITLSSTTYDINLNQGERVYFRGNEGVFNHYVVRGTEQAYTKITANQTFNVGGNINTLINYYNPNNLTLPQGVFNNLFGGNVNLVSAENLILQPSSDGSLPTFAYLYLFRNCTSLTKPPVLIAKTLSNSSYYSLFDGCSKLDNLTVYTDDNSQTNCTYKWLNGVASTGTLYNNGSATYVTDSVNGIPTGWVEKKTDYLYIQNTYEGENTITLKTTQSGTPASGTYATSVEYSKDKITWTTLSLAPGVTNTISLNQGEKIYFRNDSGYFNYTDDSNNYYTSITGSKSHKLGGNINTLINYTDLSNVSLSQGCFNRMFLNDIELVDASDLELPSTTLTPHCYRAFLNNCQSLLYAPALPATTLANKCYYAMFYGDNSLTTAPEFPATTLAESCYDSIFKNCTSLTSVTIYATSTAKGSFGSWLNNVAASGTVYNNGGVSLPKNSISGIPTGWVEVKS